MQVNNVSRKTIESWPFPWFIDNQHWLISINSSWSKPANISAPFGKVFRFVFDDVTSLQDGTKLVSDLDIKGIAEIIKEAEREQIPFLWVHCDAGICRSGAVVEMCVERGHYVDEQISNERWPNKLILKKLRECFNELG